MVEIRSDVGLSNDAQHLGANLYRYRSPLCGSLESLSGLAGSKGDGSIYSAVNIGTSTMVRPHWIEGLSVGRLQRAKV